MPPVGRETRPLQGMTICFAVAKLDIFFCDKFDIILLCRISICCLAATSFDINPRLQSKHIEYTGTYRAAKRHIENPARGAREALPGADEATRASGSGR